MRFYESVQILGSHNWFWIHAALLLGFLWRLWTRRLFCRRYLFTHYLQVIFKLTYFLFHHFNCLFTDHISLWNLSCAESYLLNANYQIFEFLEQTGKFLVTFNAEVWICVASCNFFSHLLKKFSSRTNLPNFKFFFKLFEKFLKFLCNQRSTKALQILDHIFNNL
jgi:hypothetical protein